MGKGGTGLGIIGIILSAGAIGFAFIVWNGKNTTNSDIGDLTDELNNLIDELNNLTNYIFVGIWDDLDDNQDFVPYNLLNDWLFEFLENKLNNSDYISVSKNNTRITLLKSGWYRIHLSASLSAISPTKTYYISLFKDGTLESYLDLYYSAADSSFYHNIDSSVLVYSNSTNYIEIHGYSSDNFQVYINIFNQLTIEYVAI